jgi:hypothetical protein
MAPSGGRAGRSVARLGSVRWGSKTLLAAILALLLGAGFVACGDEDDSGTTGAAQTAPAETRGGDDGAAGGGEDRPKAGNSEDGSGGDDRGDDSFSDASDDFAPEQHDDSGGGSEQFRVKGGDNSVQEFGEEAGASERDKAAAALHNFLDARAQGAWAAACDYLASSISSSLQQLAGQGKAPSCPVLLESLTNPGAKELLVEEAEQADVGSLRFEGDRAFIIYRGTENTIYAMSMVEEDGEWKVASLAGTPLN